MLDIELFLKDDGSLNLSRLTKTDIGKKFLYVASSIHGNLKPSQLAYRVYHNLTDFPRCKGCDAQLGPQNFIDFKRGYRDYCSCRCASKFGPAKDALIKTLQSDKFKQKRREKIIARYGTPSMICVNRQKAIDTSMERYGVDNPLKSEYAKQRKIEKVIERYGVDNVWKIPAIQQKIKDTLEAKYGVSSSLQLVDWSKVPISKGHQSIVDFLLTLDPSINVSINNRKLIAPYEIDIYLPDHQIAIEYDGLYWHAEKAGKDAQYHINKTEMVEAVGCRLIHVFEDEWRDKQAIVKSRLKNLLQLNRRVFARQCIIKEVNHREAASFLERCHIQGRARSKIQYGLYFQDSLVALMTFGQPRFNTKYQWELIRYATELDLTVVGGASRLLAYFRKNYTGTIISYADVRWSQGNLYRQLGFKEIGVTRPSYFYIHPKTITRINRVNAQKHRLDQLLGEKFDSTKTEAENMANAGYDRIFDCGNYVFVLT